MKYKTRRNACIHFIMVSLLAASSAVSAAGTTPSRMPDLKPWSKQQLSRFQAATLESARSMGLDVRMGPDELLYVLTDEEQGAVLRIEPAD